MIQNPLVSPQLQLAQHMPTELLIAQHQPNILHQLVVIPLRLGSLLQQLSLPFPCDFASIVVPILQDVQNYRKMIRKRRGRLRKVRDFGFW